MARKSIRRKAEGKRVDKASLPDGLMNEAPVTYPIAGASITALQLYHNPDRKPSGDGPWNDEADKVSWVDGETGLGCIMLRQKNGTISGYVGVGPQHPLFGFEADAVPVEISNVVHGGVTYGKACEVNRFAREAYGMTQALGPLLDRMTGVDLDASCETWLASITRTSAGAHPPAQHILLQTLLDDWEGRSEDWRAENLKAISGSAASAQGSAPFSLDWEAIDRDYSIRIRRRAHVLSLRSPPVRVSLAAVERGLGGRDWLAKRRDRMPISVRAVEDVSEAIEAFRHRRMRWHLDRCAREGVEDPWVVVKRAGLPGSFIETVKAALPVHASLARLPRAVVLRVG